MNIMLKIKYYIIILLFFLIFICFNCSFSPISKKDFMAIGKKNSKHSKKSNSDNTDDPNDPDNPDNPDDPNDLYDPDDPDKIALFYPTKFVDGDRSYGINKNPSYSAYHSEFEVFNNKLYAIWFELNNKACQVRVVVYNGNDSLPVWSFVDGNGINGLNKNPNYYAYWPRLAVFNNKLYAIWREDNGTAYQVRVVVYNGNDSLPAWTFVDGSGINGLNKNPNFIAATTKLIVFNNKLYASWREDNGTAYQVRVVVFNGNDSLPVWSFVDGNGINGINKNPNYEAVYPQLMVLNNKLYATWYEHNGTAYQVRVAVYNGNDSLPVWSFVDGNGTNGINKNTNYEASVAQLAVFDNKLYAIWREDNGTAYQIRIAVYNGNDSLPVWSFVDGNGTIGINKNSNYNANFPQLAEYNNKLYAFWCEYNGKVDQIRAAIYNGNDSLPVWSFVDGNGVNGIYKNSNYPVYPPQVIVFNNNFYVTWPEYNGKAYQIRVAVNTE